jgi:CubicO group peptidase (beta-lactamase class C family)
MRLMTLAALAALFLCIDAAAQTPSASSPESDPVRLRLMQGFPVPPAAQVRWDDGSVWTFPNTRWSFSHMRELLPSAPIRRSGAPTPLRRAERADLDTVSFTTLDGRRMTWRESLDANYTDGIVVLHRGRIVYERYFGALGPSGEHVAMSVTKSLVGTLAEALIAEGRLDPRRRVGSYVPELAASAFGDASLRQVMDMRTGLQYSEDYRGFGSGLSDVSRMEIAAGRVPPPTGYTGPLGIYAYAASIAKSGEHGGEFVYKTPNSIVLGWVLERVTGKSLASQIEERFWLPMGMEQDASLAVDRLGTAFSGAGFSASLRDMARFGEMIRLGGRWNGRQILPSAAVEAIVRRGDPAAFANTNYPGLEGGSYASQWWHRAGGQVLALGIHGQGIYIDRNAELVIARFASHPTASNRGINPTTIPAYDAIAAHLTAHPTQQ